MGYVRYDTQDALDAMNDLYRNELRWFQNFFQPCVKLQRKVRIGSKLTRRYDKPRTPWQRVLASPHRDPGKAARLKALFKTLNPFELAKMIDQKLAAIYQMSSTLKHQGSRPLPKILPAQNRKPNAAFNAPQPAHPHSVPESTVAYNWVNDRDHPISRLRTLIEKEKFLAAS